MTPGSTPRADRSPSRMVAIAVLAPAVPLLLMSVAALVVFYLAPARFNAWLARIPGDDVIRTALIFAPATLAAVVVMAVLYATEAPRREAAEATRPSRRPGVRARRRGSWARASLWLTVPALVVVAAAQAVEFVAPDRVEALLRALPATGLLTRLFDLSPIIALAAVGVGLILGYAVGDLEPSSAPQLERSWSTPRLARLGALLTLFPSLGLLLLSGAGLALILVSPDRLEWLADRLPAETLLRLGLVLSPAMFIGLVLLAGLYLTAPLAAEPPLRKPAATVGGLRSGLAVGVLVAGLGFTALVGTGVLAAVVFILVAR